MKEMTQRVRTLLNGTFVVDAVLPGAPYTFTTMKLTS